MSEPQVRADEVTFVMPSAWRREVHPRRDRPGPWPEVRIDENAPARARALIESARAEIDDALAHADTCPNLAGSARAHRAGDADPAGAAAIAKLTVAARGLGAGAAVHLFQDAWVAEHGVPFAARAYAEMFEVVADWRGVRTRRPDEPNGGWWAASEQARRVRALLAAAPEAVYDASVQALAGHRRTSVQQMVTAYLAPTRDDWVTYACAVPTTNFHSAEYSLQWMVLCALGEPHQAATPGLTLDYYSRTQAVVATLLDGVGPAATVPLLTTAIDDRHTAVGIVRWLLDVLSTLPVDAAFQALLDRLDNKHVRPAALAAANRFPARALRLLAASPDGFEAGELLSAHLLVNAPLADEMLPGLPEASQETIRAAREKSVRLPEAETLPPLLTDPPWMRTRAKTKPTVVKGLVPPGSRSMVWEPGERDAWHVDTAGMWPQWATGEWPVAVDRFQRGDLLPNLVPILFLEAPEELVRPLLGTWEPTETLRIEELMPGIVARFELDALDAALIAARCDPGALGRILLPYLTDDVAQLMAGWLIRLKKGGKTARAWFHRHGLAAVPALVPDALAGKRPERLAAEAALRLIASRHGSDQVTRATRSTHGEKAAAAIEALLHADPLEILPAKIPSVPAWADPALLPQILLRDRAHALPATATGHFVTMLAMSKPDDVYAGVTTVRELCDPSSLAEFGWALFRRWEAGGAPPKAGWALTQLGLTGDDGTVRRLTPLIRAWPGDGGHAKAVNGLDALAGIGTDVALMHLHGIAQRVRFKALKTRAQEKIAEVAAGLGLTPDRLADRLVPDLGLDASGSRVLDYGPRRFVVGFDEQLRPYVTDEDGTPRKTLPKPGAKDDPDLAPAAHKAFATLKKDVRTLASDQLRRLETAMVTGRRWPLGEFRDLLADHPLLRHIVRRLVWLDDEGTAFRVAEDGTLADTADDTLVLTATATVRIAHPIDLGDTVPLWSQTFADYEIIQPFPQLGRPVHRLTDEERTTGRLTRFEDVKVPVGKVLGLERRGWRRGIPQDAGVECWISRPLPGGRHLVIDLDPGITAGAPDVLPDQTLATIAICARPEDLWRGRHTPAPADVDEVTASEFLTDLTHLTAD